MNVYSPKFCNNRRVILVRVATPRLARALSGESAPLIGQANDGAGSVFWLLVSGLPSATLKRRPLVMLQAYFDDSGSEGRGPVFLVSGYVATAENWARFSDEWQAILDGPPKLEYFKMREANSLRGQFWGWPESDRDAVLMHLAQIIKARVSLGITSALWYEDFDAACAEFRNTTAEWKGLHQYQILFHGTMGRIATYYIKAKSKERVEFIFDEQGFWGLQAIIGATSAFPFLEPDEPSIIAGPPTQKSDKEYLPLQAADLIAWQTRKFIVENSDVDLERAYIEDSRVNSPVMRLLQTIPTIYNTYGVHRLRKVLSDFAARETDPVYHVLRKTMR